MIIPRRSALGDRSRRFVSMSAGRWPASIKIECGVGVAHVSRVKCVVKSFGLGDCPLSCIQS